MSGFDRNTKYIVCLLFPDPQSKCLVIVTVKPIRNAWLDKVKHNWTSIFA